MIRRSGENISVRVVEAVLTSIDGIRMRRLLGCAIRTWRGMKAYVALKPGVDRDALAPDRILGEAKKSLASIKVPRYLEYMRERPRTPLQIWR